MEGGEVESELGSPVIMNDTPPLAPSTEPSGASYTDTTTTPSPSYAGTLHHAGGFATRNGPQLSQVIGAAMREHSSDAGSPPPIVERDVRGRIPPFASDHHPGAATGINSQHAHSRLLAPPATSEQPMSTLSPDRAIATGDVAIDSIAVR